MKITLHLDIQYGYYCGLMKVKNRCYAGTEFSPKKICRQLSIPISKYYKEIRKYPTFKSDRIYIKNREDAQKFREFLEIYLVMEKITK